MSATKNRKRFSLSLALGLICLIHTHTGMAAAEPVAGNKWINMGPAPIKNSSYLGGDLSGRHSDFAVDPANSAHWLSATAGGVWETFDSGATWAARSDFQESLGVSALSFGANIGAERNVYAGTGAGFYIGLGIGPLRSVDGGTTWQKITTTPSFADKEIWAIKAHPSAAGTVLMTIPYTTDQGVWKTTNANSAASTWIKVLPGLASDLQVSAANFSYQMAGIANNGLYRTLTAWEPNASGARWEKISGPWDTALCNRTPPATGTTLCGVGSISVAIAPSDQNVAYVSVANASDTNNPDTGNAAQGYGRDGGVLAMWRIDGAFTSTPTFTQLPDWRVGTAAKGGAAYNANGSYFEDYGPGALRVDPMNPNILYMGMVIVARFDGSGAGGAAAGAWNNAGSYKSPANLTSEVHPDIFGMTWAGQKMVLATDGGVYASPDPVTTPFLWTNIPWEERNSNQSTIQFSYGSIHPSNAGGMMGGVQDKGWLQRRGEEWQFFGGGDGGWNLYSKSNPDNYWISGGSPTTIGRRLRMANGDYQHTYAGLVSASLAAGEGDNNTGATEQCPSNENIVVVGTSRVWKSSNIFNTPDTISPSWTPLWDINSPPSGYNAAKISAFAFAPSDTTCNTFAFGTTDGQIWLTQNGGTSWRRIQNAANPMPSIRVADLDFNPKNGNVLYLTLGDWWSLGYLFRIDAVNTTPLVTNITPSASGKFASHIYALAIDPYNADTATTMYAAARNGPGGVLWKTSNAHATTPTWTPYTSADGMPNVDVMDIKLNEATGKLVAFTWGRGAFMLASPVDLVATAFSPIRVTQGSASTINFTVCNYGSSASGSFRADVRSTSPSGTSEYISSVFYATGLAGGACQSSSIPWTVPTTSGKYKLNVIVDPAFTVSEGQENNNTLTTDVAVMGTSDLIAVDGSITPNCAQAQSVSVSYRVRNQGAGTTGQGFMVGFYLLDSANVGTYLGAASAVSLAASTDATGTATFPLPGNLANGTYRLAVVADSTNAIMETNDENNTTIMVSTLTLPLPNSDLAMQAVNIGSLLTTGGQVLAITDTVNNLVSAAAGGFDVGYYLVSTKSFQPPQFYLGARNLSGLACSASNSGSANLALSGTVPADKYTLWSKADYANQVVETNEGNNTLSGATITVQTDLAATHTYPSGSILTEGNSISVTNTVCNGPSTATDVWTGIYLSKTAIVNPNSITDTIFLGERTNATMAAGACNTATTTVKIPGGRATGSYYLAVLADESQLIPDSNPANNSQSVPVTLQAADLTLPALTATVVTTVNRKGVTTNNLSIGSQVKNQGNAAAGAFTIGFYLSTDALYDASDISACSIAVSSLAASASNPSTGVTTTSCPFPGTAIKGAKYYVIGVADSANTVAESVESNNNLSTTTQITVP